MPLDPASLHALAVACAPQVAPDTLLAVIRVESAGEPLAIGVNGPRRAHLSPRTPQEAVAQARDLLEAGRNLDLGLGQINVSNLAPLGLSLTDAFDPCRNLAASARVLQSDWRRASPGAGSALGALQTTFSFYNTGSPIRGLRNGYAARVTAAARPAADRAGTATPPSSRPVPPAWLVFGGEAAPTFVISPEDGARP